jgi:hypothetical protein
MFKYFFIALILLTTSCENNSVKKSLKKLISREKVDETNILGAWSFESPSIGKVFLQFEPDNNGIKTLLVHYTYEEEHKERLKWSIGESVNGDQVLYLTNWDESNYTIIDWPLGLNNYFSDFEFAVHHPVTGEVVRDVNGKLNTNKSKGIKISDFSSDKFSISPSSSASGDDSPLQLFRLKDEAGEPIYHYSLFERESVPDDRYGGGQNEPETNQDGISSEKCNTCGIELVVPQNRTCDWCGNTYDGWGYYLHDGKIQKEHEGESLVECVNKGGVLSMFGRDIHNGQSWTFYSNSCCSKKCAFQE